MINERRDYVWAVWRPDTGEIAAWGATRADAEAIAQRLGPGHDVAPRPAGSEWGPLSA